MYRSTLLSALVSVLFFISNTHAATINCGSSVSGDSAQWYCINRLGFPSYEDLYELTLTRAMRVTVSSCDSAFDTVLYITNTDWSYIYAEANDGPTCGDKAVLDAFLAPGKYLVIIEGRDRNGGHYTIDLSCVEANCQAPNIPYSNAGFTCDNTNPGGECTFACNEGYESNDGTRISCNLGGLWNSLPQCVGVVCEAPLVIPNSNAATECGQTPRSAGEYCSFDCDAGYRAANGRDEIVRCEEDGNWETPPICEPVPSCDAPYIGFSNSAVCGGTPERSNCYVYCEEGYLMPEGQSNKLTCEQGGQWEWQVSSIPKPTCEPVVVCDAPIIEHSSQSITCGNTPAFLSCPYKCDSGYHVDGDKFPSITCKEDGTWDYTIVPPCTEALRSAPIVDTDGDGVDDVSEKVALEFERQFRQQLCNLLYPGDPDVCDDIKYLMSGQGSFYNWERMAEVEVDCYDTKGAAVCNDALFDALFGGKLMGCASNLRAECALYCDACDEFEWIETRQVADAEKYLQLNVQPHKSNEEFYEDYDFFVTQMLTIGDDTIEDEIADLRQQFADKAQEQLEYKEAQIPKYLQFCPFFSQYVCPLEGEGIETVIIFFDKFLVDMGLQSVIDGFENDKNLIQARIDELQDNFVSSLRKPIQAISDAIDAGSLDPPPYTAVASDTGKWYPNWINSPNPIDLLEDLGLVEEQFVELMVSIKSSSSFTTSFTETSAVNFVAKNAGSYEYMRFDEQDIDFKLNVTLENVTQILVYPDDWYDDNWQSILHAGDGQYFRDELYNLEEESGSSRQSVYGDTGVMNSVIRSLIVATKVSIDASFKMSMSQEEIRKWNNASTSVLLPGVCTQDGKACVDYGSIFIGTDAPQHGGNVNGENVEGWKLIEHVTKTYLSKLPVGDEKDRDLIVGLGTVCAPSGPPAMWPTNDAGAALFSVATELDLQEPQCFDGVNSMNDFFNMWDSEQITPRIVYLPGNGVNGIDQAEGDFLKAKASTINDMVGRGVGLMAFGSGDNALGWLFELLPDLIEKTGCDITNAMNNQQTDRKISGLTKEMIRESGGCTTHFDGDGESYGDLDPIATDSEGRNFILSGISITKSSEPNLSTGSSQTYIETDPDDPSRLIIKARIATDNNTPKIIAINGHRFER